LSASTTLLLFVAAVNYSVPEPPPVPPWTVTGTTHAQHMLVVHVEALATTPLREIGESIVRPVEGKYDEILIYVRCGKSSLRRIQWTRLQGFRELVISS
jgi:hypothetical protein